MESLEILLVEDELIMAMDIRETLERAGHRVLAVARNHQEVQQAMQKRVPDLVILDIHLDGSTADGLTIAREIQANYPLPIIYLTGHSEPQTYQATKDTRPIAYLLKPFVPAELVTEIEKAYTRYLAGQVHYPEAGQSLFLPALKGHRRINPAEVLYMETANECVNVYLYAQGKPHFIGMTMARLAPYFSTPNFYRLTRSLLINLDHLDRVEPRHIYMTTLSTPLAISESKRQELLRQLTIVRTK